ncbi:MAG: hypothetical protein JJT82_01605 [Legionellaceae bacterium]|nr:hypothetical protein [Legionellaceae bacterium]
MFRKYLTVLLIFCFCSPIFCQTTSEVHEPQVVGYAEYFLFPDFYDVKFDDTCPQDYFHNPIKKKVEIHPSVETYKEQFQSSLPKTNECHWTIDISASPYQMNEEFPFVEEGKSNIYNTYSFTAKCYDENGSEKDWAEKNIAPVFQCPANTAFHPELGCITYLSDICSGDVVARQLDTWFLPLADQGHVGIIMRAPSEDKRYLNSYVVEVLKPQNKILDNALTVNKLQDFKDVVVNGYWGEKFGINKPNHLNFIQYQVVLITIQSLLEAINSNYLHINYSFYSTPSLPYEQNVLLQYNRHKERFEYVTSMVDASFRCDGFVRYALESVPGIKFHLDFITPRLLYMNLFSIRNGRDGYFTDMTKMGLRGDALEDQIKNIFLYDEVNYHFEEVINSYISSKTFDKKHKILFFLDILKQVNSVPDKYDYILEILETLNPFEFFDDFKHIYETTTDEALKASILSALKRSILFSSFIETAKLTDQQIDMIVQIQLFIEEQMKKQMNQAQLSNEQEKLRKLLIEHMKKLNKYYENLVKMKKAP